MWLFVFSSLFACILIVQAEPCDSSEEEQIKLIKNTILEASKDLYQICLSYGVQNFEGYDRGITNDHRLASHYVCNSIDFDERKLFVLAVIGQDDLKEGTTGYKHSKDKLKYTYHGCKCDEAGHIIPNEVGGSGYYYNLFAQDHNLNGIIWNSICKRISNFLSEVTALKRHVTMKIYFIYNDNEHPFRPSGYFFNFDYHEEIDEEIHVIKSDYGFLENESHDRGQWRQCTGAQEQNLLFINKVDDMYWSRRSCSINKERIKFYYGPFETHPLTKYSFRNIQFFKSDDMEL